MELKDFIVKSVDDIINATISLQNIHKDSGAVINPREQSHAQHANPKKIEFDIAVTAEKDVEGQVKGGIRVLDIGISSDGKINSNYSHTTRLKFYLEVILPSKEQIEKYRHTQVSNYLSQGEF